MLIKHLTLFITTVYRNPVARGVFLTLYYLAILVGLALMYGRGDFSTVPFIYQGF